MKYPWHIILVCTVIACSSNKKISIEKPTLSLHQILEEECCATENGIAGMSLTVVSPDLGIDFSNAIGHNSLERNDTLLVQQPFRIASLTKVFVATAILRLYEQNKLALNDPISQYISEKHRNILTIGGYDPDAITMRHCLTHSSGLYDYAEGGPEYIEEASKDPNKRWTRTEQLQFAMDNGLPKGQPGEVEHYSDTGYILLGEIIEERTGLGLAEGLRQLLKFDALGMSATYLESLETRPIGLLPNVRRYMGEIDASDWDNSIDLYGGGGLVSTTGDLIVFLQALFNGKIFDKTSTLDVMLLKKAYPGKEKKLPNQRLGFGAIVGKKTGLEVYLHTGFWGTVFMHIPKYNCSIALNNTNDGDSAVLQRTLDYIVQKGKKQGE